MLPSLVFFPAPSEPYLTQAEMANWLGIDEKTLRKYIRRGKLLSGKPRLPGAKQHFWSQEVAALNKKLIDNLDRLEGNVQPVKRKRKPPQNGS